MIKNSDVLIIIPAYNEAESVVEVVEEILQVCPQYDYVVINDGSNDETKSVLRRLDYNHINCSTNLGVGGAVQTGYLYAREYGYDIAVQLDGDGQHNPADIWKLVHLLKNGGVEYAIGSRFIHKDGFISSPLRRCGIRILSNLIYFLFSTRIKDVTSGFRAVNRYFIEFFSENYSRKYPEPRAIAEALKHGRKISEVAVTMRERSHGNSSIGVLDSLEYMIRVTADILSCKFGKDMLFRTEESRKVARVIQAQGILEMRMRDLEDDSVKGLIS